MKKGISLMELVASMCIIAALATAVTPVVGDLVQRSRDTHALQDISALQDHLIALGDSLNLPDALLDEQYQTLFLSDLAPGQQQGAIPEVLKSQFDVKNGALLPEELALLQAAGIQQIAYRRAIDYSDQIEDRLQWDRIQTIGVEPVELVRLNMLNPAVQSLVQQKFAGIDVFEEDGVTPINHTLVVVGIGQQSDLVKKISTLPTDLNASAPLVYDRYLAVVWVGTRESDDVTPVVSTDPLTQAKILGVVDSQLRTKSELAKVVCP
jgi:hypothetical protein